MANVKDRWHTTSKETGRKVRTDRYGTKGLRWQAAWPEAGRERTKAFATKVEAVHYLAARASGAPLPARGARGSLAAALEVWQARHEHQAPGTLIKARYLGTKLPAELRSRPLASITREDVQELVNAWGQGLKPQSVKNLFVALKSVFALAIEDGKLAANPCNKVLLPKLASAGVTPLTEAQVTEIAERMAPELRSMVIVAAATGLRSGELRGLTWDRVSETEIYVDRQLREHAHLGFGPTKTPSSVRRVTLGKVARDALRAHREAFPAPDGGLIWQRRGNGLGSRTVIRAWQDAIAGIPNMRERSGWHELRHFNASLLIAAGLSVVAVANRLGHSDPSITLKTYAHLWPTDQARATSVIDERLSHLA